MNNPKTATDFILAYETALASQQWHQVYPLISREAVVIFSDGTLHLGISKIKAAFERNFAIIKSEKYAITNVNWLKTESDFAVFTFEYNWTGLINKQKHSGSGIGSSTIIKEDGTWKLLCEHLSKKPK